MNDTETAVPPTPASWPCGLRLVKRVVVLCLCCGVLFVVASCSGVFRFLGFGQAGALDRAYELSDAGEYDRAIVWCERAIRRGPFYAEPYRLRGSCWEKKGDLDRALGDYNVAIGLTPDASIVGYIGRGRVYEKMGEDTRAVYDYAYLILDQPDSTRGPQLYADIRAEREGGDTLDEMIAFFERAVREHPYDKDLKECLAILRKASSRAQSDVSH